MEPNKQQHSHQSDIDEQLKERFLQLPKVVQDAVTSADVEKRMRALADKHNLHLDQWQKLENEVMLALLGFEHVEDLQKNVEAEIGLTPEIARALIADVNTIVFEPVRQELERGLTHPEAKATAVSGAEAARKQILDESHAEAAASLAATSTPESEVVRTAFSQSPMPTPQSTPTAPQSVVAATPPAPAPEVKVARPSQSTEYRPGETSTARIAVVDDPYREPPL